MSRLKFGKAGTRSQKSLRRCQKPDNPPPSAGRLGTSPLARQSPRGFPPCAVLGPSIPEQTRAPAPPRRSIGGSRGSFSASFCPPAVERPAKNELRLKRKPPG